MMGSYTATLLLCGFVLGCEGFLMSGLIGDTWDALQVKWGLNPFSSFEHMPRTTADAVKAGFKKISDCDKRGKWRGSQYVKDKDTAIILLYDVKGYIAGIQTTVPKGLPNKYPSARIQPPFVDNGSNYILTAYFVDPSIICTTGRTAQQFKKEGTGTNLYIQNGTPEQKMAIPKAEKDIGKTKWVLGKCFLTMGNHYWYDISENMNCDYFFPVFLMYNGGKLNGFGWALQGDFKSAWWEHPRSSLFGYFMKTPPKCLYKTGVLSTLHIFLTKKAVLNNC